MEAHSIAHVIGGRNFTAEIMLEVCTNACTEPHLQPLSGETLVYATANVAHLDISVAVFRIKRLF